MIFQTKKAWSTDNIRKKLVAHFKESEVKIIAKNVMVKKSASMVHIRIDGKHINIYGSLNSSHVLTYVGLILGPVIFMVMNSNEGLYIKILTSLISVIVYFVVLWQTQKKAAEKMKNEVVKILNLK